MHSSSSLENHTRFQTKMGKVCTHFQTKEAQNHTLWGGTYLYGLDKGLHPRQITWYLCILVILLSLRIKPLLVVPSLSVKKQHDMRPYCNSNVIPYLSLIAYQPISSVTYVQTDATTLSGQQCWELLRPCWQWYANG